MIFHSFSRWFWPFLLTAFIVPLFVIPKALYPFIYSKAVIFHTLVFLTVVFLIILLLFKESFLKQVSEKLKILSKNRIFQSWLLYFFFFSFSLFFAIDKFFGFWGSLERSEGWVGLFFYTLFFILLLLFFQEKKLRQIFFGFFLISGLIILFGAIYQKINGLERPIAFLGNPAYLGIHFIFLTFLSLWFWQEFEKKRWRHLFLGLAFLFLVGVFLVVTRGPIVGVIAGFLVLLLLFVYQNQNKKWRQFGRVLLGLSLLLMIFFILTRSLPFWQKVPGFDRLAQVSLEDPTTRARLINAKIALASVNPQESPVRFLFGWGWENYVFAWATHYDWRLYQYDQQIFDRPHNKLLDVLVMNGFLGLLSYLLLWFFIFKEIFKLENFLTKIPFLFFGTAYFVQNLFIFDHFISWINFFSFLALLIAIRIYEK